VSIRRSRITYLFKAIFGREDTFPSGSIHKRKEFGMLSHEWRRTLKSLIALISCILLLGVACVLPALIWVQLGGGISSML
jgi:hypothetical protein